MATGKVLQFDQVRGYGFVAADDGGDDVFLHASAFDGDSGDLIPGIDLEFQIMASDRGRKAYSVHLGDRANLDDRANLGDRAPVVPEQFTPSRVVSVVTTSTDEEQMCDVLSHAEFTTALTELLLNAEPGLSGPQILRVRKDILDFATRRGWVDA